MTDGGGSGPGDLLHRSWGHSFEEDHDDVTVYRPTGWAFPRARGRGGLEFRPDGTFLAVDAGPGDAARPAAGRWEPAAGSVEAAADRVLVRGAAGERSLQIVHLSADRLEVVPVAPTPRSDEHAPPPCDGV
ncbi:hypothetical protein [Kineococcus siccus]|uniref:hypothetical protein n=1 Tax=Kineococcus siccus TaxID=2696567 RepID=UPI001412D72A|nr:hypothetical protein [Kineococcus siccus]